MGKLLESGLKHAELLQILPADRDWAILAVKDGDDVRFGGIVRVGKHWQLTGELGKQKANPSWDWRVAVMGKIG